MRYEKGHKEETRRRIVDVASQRFRKDGIAATGLAGLMADAGLTHGGFYAHFSSKDDLVRDALAASLVRTRDLLSAEARHARERGEDGLEAIVQRYLRPAHRDRPEAGCAVATLAPEVCRCDAKTRDLMSSTIRDVVSIIAAELPSSNSKQAARDTAYAIYGLMIGALQVARLTRSASASEGILRAAREAALELAHDKD